MNYATVNTIYTLGDIAIHQKCKRNTEQAKKMDTTASDS